MLDSNFAFSIFSGIFIFRASNSLRELSNSIAQVNIKTSFVMVCTVHRFRAKIYIELFGPQCF